MLRVLPQDRACFTAKQLDLLSMQTEFFLVTNQAVTTCDTVVRTVDVLDSAYILMHREDSLALKACNKASKELLDHSCEFWCKTGYVAVGGATGGVLFGIAGLITGLYLAK